MAVFIGFGDSRNRFGGYLLAKNRRQNGLDGDQSRSFGKVTGSVGKDRPRDSYRMGFDGCRREHESVETGAIDVGAVPIAVGAAAIGVGRPVLAKIAADFAKIMALAGTKTKTIAVARGLMADSGKDSGRGFCKPRPASLVGGALRARRGSQGTASPTL